MTNEMISVLGTQSVMLIVLVSIPIVIVGTVAGLGVSLFQAVTQLQEQTLSYGVKLVAVAVALVVTFPQYGDTVMNFTKFVFTIFPTATRG